MPVQAVICGVPQRDAGLFRNILLYPALFIIHPCRHVADPDCAIHEADPDELGVIHGQFIIFIALCIPREQEASTQRWLYVGPASATLVRHKINAGSLRASCTLLIPHGSPPVLASLRLLRNLRYRFFLENNSELRIYQKLKGTPWDETFSILSILTI